jgi:hypothetical protein
MEEEGQLGELITKETVDGKGKEDER